MRTSSPRERAARPPIGDLPEAMVDRTISTVSAADRDTLLRRLDTLVPLLA